MKHTCLLVTALLLTCCGGGADNTPAPPPVPRKSRLAAFDTGGLDAGLTLPDFTDYWTLSEQRNGNSYPVKADVTDEAVMVLRLGADGAFAANSGEWVVESLPTIGRKMEALGKKFWNSEKKASAAAIILFADVGAPYVSLLELCRELVDLQVRNLWLVTRDRRDDAARLLPLKVDTDQLFREWYFLAPEEIATTLIVDADGIRPRAGGANIDLKAPLSPENARALAGATRVQFVLAADADVGRFATAANLAAPVGYVDVEPFWPVLDMPHDNEPLRVKRELVEFDDDLGIAAGMDLPTLNEYWRAVASGERLPAPVEIDDESPLLGLRVASDGRFSTRARGEPEWTMHQDDMGFIQALQRNAGEIDFDTGVGTLQLVLAVERKTSWETFLGVLEIAASSGVHRIFVVTNDVVGPTPRLLDLSLPIGGGLENAVPAKVDLTRRGIAADGNYTVKFSIDGKTHEYSGARFASSLTDWTAGRQSDPDVLLVRMPRDEPFETLFTILNATAWLGMNGIRIGG
ncbi:MAG: hypothetical protein K8I27_08265 [Planctomycetes bacterium]|nr:hypothetical protein [Planctomycetota bacterium]